MKNQASNRIRKLLCSVLALVMLLGVACPGALAASETDNYANAVLYWSNVERQRHGLTPFVTSDALMKAAQTRASEVAKYYSHDRPNGKNTYSVFYDYDIVNENHRVWSGSENIARGYKTPYDVVKGWLGSPDHRRSLLNEKYNYMGSGYTYSEADDYHHFWEELFLGITATIPGTRGTFYVAPTALSIKGGSTLQLKVGETKTLSASLAPVYATEEVKCTSSDPRIVKVKGVNVTDFDVKGIVNGTATLTFTCGKLTQKVTVTVGNGAFESPFNDVPASKFYYNAVLWATENGITSGVSDGLFDPYGVCTRAQSVTFLWRAAGRPEPATKVNPFKDVSSSAYFYKAVLWASENNITSGYSDGSFRPDLTVTRAQFVTFLWKYCGRPAVSADNPFTDVKSGAYYYSPVLWAYENGITSGKSAAVFGVNDPCQRYQVVVFLQKAVK